MDNCLTFFEHLRKINAVSATWEHVLIMLRTYYQISEEILKLFCLFFSLIDDGNICISMKAAILQEKWDKKLAGLDTGNDDTDYAAIIKNGINAIRHVDTPLIVECKSKNAKRADNMFVIYNDWLFTESFFAATQEIEDAMTALLSASAPSTVSDADKELKETIRHYPANYPLDDRQIDAIIRATRGDNLIITGGPGTGKTTVICYLLLELLAQASLTGQPSHIYMAALSGKAAKRMEESVSKTLDTLNADIKKKREQERDIIKAVKPTTIHSLLGAAAVNGHESKKFPANSIFVIDEASMIDVVLFANLLKVIKQSENARIFILGDKDQLPSVQPGAVFSDLTKTQTDYLIELTKTQRFAEQSEIYDLKEAIRCADETFIDQIEWTETLPANWSDELKAIYAQSKDNKDTYPVKYLNLDAQSDIQRAVTAWYDAFYDDNEYNLVYANLDLGAARITETLDAFWTRIETAKILCAENHGQHGTEDINKTICAHIKNKHGLDGDNGDKFFVGEQIIVTKNQSLYDLKNGDIGLIVSLDNKKYIMIKRAKTTDDNGTTGGKELIRHKGHYIFYPLHLVPIDSIAPAYAITIHKSQGSEYDNIFVFMPLSEKCPLLNRQILYTAITRTKKTTYIVSNANNMKQAINTSAERDTQLFL